MKKLPNFVRVNTPRRVGKSHSTNLSRTLLSILEFYRYNKLTRTDTDALYGVINEFVNLYGDPGGEAAYFSLSHYHSRLASEIDDLSARQEDLSGRIGKLTAMQEEIDDILDALSGWCHPNCHIGSGKYGKLSGTSGSVVVVGDEISTGYRIDWDESELVK